MMKLPKMCIFTLIEQKKQRNEAFARRESKRLIKEEEEQKAREEMENRRVDPGGSGPGAESFQGLA